MPFDVGCEQGNTESADPKENSEQVQHGATAIAVKIGDEDIGAGIEAASAEPE
jgi:hypothetical protein